jgi:hypothetical protein
MKSYPIFVVDQVVERRASNVIALAILLASTPTSMRRTTVVRPLWVGAEAFGHHTACCSAFDAARFRCGVRDVRVGSSCTHVRPVRTCVGKVRTAGRFRS